MKLDLDCIRNILLTVEQYETVFSSVCFEENNQDYYDTFLASYPIEVILYHVRYCIKANLLSDTNTVKVWGYISFECCMEPAGHDFLANTRTPAQWSGLQKVLSLLGDAG